MNTLLILLGKLVSKLFRLLNLGNGSTWPGHIALSLNKYFIKNLIESSHLQIIIVAGTNGKTTTSSLIKHILEKAGKNVLLNESGANMLNGIASTLMLNTNSSGKLTHDYAIFEVDENVLPRLLKELSADYLVLLNLFRDQLDRYGEVHIIADKWEKALTDLPNKTKIILNADDPEIAWLGIQRATNPIISKQERLRDPQGISHSVRNDNILYFGLDDRSLAKQTRDHAVDSVYCPKCNFPLEYKENYYSHLGNWYCPSCQINRPDITSISIMHYPLSGTYNQYNTNAAVLLSQTIGISKETINSALQNFRPAFGRQEIIQLNNKNIQIFLAKNPTGFNQSLETIHKLNGKNVLIVLNDRTADGHDVSWIWDIELERYLAQFTHLTVSGDRCFDMGLRVKYAQEFNTQNSKFKIEEDVSDAIQMALENTTNSETLYILPTYTAMLEVRKILTGKKIL